MVIGAGFTASAGIATQRELLSGIGSLNPSLAESAGASAFLKCREVVSNFVNDLFKPSSSDVFDWTSIDLEDLYSMIDRAIMDNDCLVATGDRKQSVDSDTDRREGPGSDEMTSPDQRLQRVKKSLDYCIMYYLDYLQSNSDKALHRQVFGSLVERYGDSWATVSTNWDSLWDDVLRENVEDGYLNYGAPICNISTAETCEVSRLPRAKLFKLHGSLDWAVCPSCHTVFAESPLASWHSYVSPKSCPRCGLEEEQGRYPLLDGLLLTPSMIKTMRNPSLHMIHNEAFLELRRADTVAFVGYSLPPADHDLRYLFRRALRRGTQIEVVLKDKTEVADRYRRLFGLDDSAFHYGGFESFFELRC